MSIRQSLPILIAASVVLACGQSTEPQEPFGAAYRVLAEPDPPALNASTVNLSVSYGGCRPNHVFRLKNRIDGGIASIWLYKATPDESCDMLVAERRVFELPSDVQGAASVVLLAPNGDAYTLRP